MFLWRLPAIRCYTTSIRPQTIYALSSSPGKAGVAVIRISGQHAKECITNMTLPAGSKSMTDPRQAYFRRIRHPFSGEVLDRGLVLWFPGPHSFTGEDSVELQIHGGNAVVKSVLDALHAMPHFRMAEQGEFARRAFDNDKLDLTELEGLADLLNAETEVQRRLALRQAEGGLRIPYEQWRTQIIECMATTEAVIDFGEDENIEEGVMDGVIEQVKRLHASISSHLDDHRVGEMVRNGIQVAIVGPPNAGKSSLLNRLAKREAAIVSNIPGTTRDVVEVKLNLGGYPVIVCDTAGLRESNDLVELEGIRRARQRIESSDIKICLISLENGMALNPVVKDVIDKDTYVILNKQDVISDQTRLDTLIATLKKDTGAKKIWSMSCETGEGVSLFLDQMIDILKTKYDDSVANPVLITQVRHREHLEDCIACLDNFLNMPEDEIVLSAEELRQAANALGRITGRIDVENVLDVLFGQFCIGK
ncbi:tRNA modification GTPase GTPBP3, mitochondrial [Choanephora cucurbitarum]|uniref:tRNA modification GTPase GTPBP3, mitochondrial n=1 Tax=Choanephora cucurbitarum TaxID=101091 RepID=A0A1C7NC28_9FUNG|nr:tRNA modification GTPase GTPBP3, mitochondrial [Choanephora cucurbitarum]